MSSQSAPATPHHPPSSGFNLAGIAVLALLLAVGAAYLLDEMGRTSRTPTPSLEDGNPIVQTISGRELTIPTASVPLWRANPRRLHQPDRPDPDVRARWRHSRAARPSHAAAP
ncbi:hypothetical protein N8D56_14780 [Devosia sp. A8/3-2]|nr:hypothetical protein N8D56_14780 [Devosia sp. A8/3-2]